MGMEAACNLRVGKESYRGRARMDADHIDFTGQTKFRFRLSEIREPSFASGTLRFDFHGNKIALSVGDRTEKWYDAVIHPKSPADKLGVRAASIVRVVNLDEEAILDSIASKKAIITRDRGDSCEVILLGVDKPGDLKQLPSLAETLRADGVLWVVLPKSARTVTQGNVQAAARLAGLFDLRQVSLSDTHAAYRLARASARRNNGARTAAAAKPSRARKTRD